MKDCSPFDLHKVKNFKNICYTVKDNQNYLKRNHCYYFQIQLTLAILDLEYCDFIIWSGLHSFATERINRDEIFINYLTQKLLKVHKILAGEYFEMRLPRNLSLYLIEDDHFSIAIYLNTLVILPITPKLDIYVNLFC